MNNFKQLRKEQEGPNRVEVGVDELVKQTELACHCATVAQADAVAGSSFKFWYIFVFFTSCFAWLYC